MRKMNIIFNPADGYASFYQQYLDNVPNDGYLLQHLSDINAETEHLILGLSEEQLNYRYSQDKWTIKDILVHLADKTDLPGFDEKLFALNANVNKATCQSHLRTPSAPSKYHS